MDTTYLVIGDGPGGSKVKQAEKYGTEQIDEDGLQRLLKEGNEKNQRRYY